MKFVSSHKVTDYAQRLYDAQTERDALRQRVKTLNAEIEALEVFLQARKPEGFQFADKEGYLMQAVPVPGERDIVDLAKVRRDYAKWGKKLPMKTPRWLHLALSYVLE